MPTIPTISNPNLKAALFIHFIFISLTTIGHWLPVAYLFYNFSLIFLLMWTLIEKNAEDPIQLAFIVNLLSIVLDVFVLAFRYPDNLNSSEQFTAALAILHLIARPFTSLLLLKVFRERTGNPDLFANIYPSGRNENYEDIDNSTPRTQPPQQSKVGTYDFEPQQI